MLLSVLLTVFLAKPASAIQIPFETNHCSSAEIQTLETLKERFLSRDFLSVVKETRNLSETCQSDRGVHYFKGLAFSLDCNTDFQLSLKLDDPETTLFHRLSQVAPDNVFCHFMPRHFRMDSDLFPEERELAAASFLSQLGTMLNFAVHFAPVNPPNFCSQRTITDERAASLFAVMNSIFKTKQEFRERREDWRELFLTCQKSADCGLIDSSEISEKGLRFMRGLLMTKRFGFGECMAENPVDCCP